MGLARAKSTTLIGRAAWKSNWEWYSDKEVKPLYDRVMDHLLNRHPYGEYLALEEIFGQEVAMRLGEGGEVIMPPHRVNTKRKATEDASDQPSGKRKALESDDSDLMEE